MSKIDDAWHARMSAYRDILDHAQRLAKLGETERALELMRRTEGKHAELAKGLGE